MNNIFLFLVLFLTYNSFSQTDTINTQSHKLNLKHLAFGESSYLVYFQDAPNSYKYNIEIWDRLIKQNANNTYKIKWKRQNSRYIHNYEIHVDEHFKPLSEQITKSPIGKTDLKIERKFYVFENNKMITSLDSLKHNTEEFSIEQTGLAFNWELDLETLGIMHLDQYGAFAVNFYHPGSKTPAKYYLYEKVREETLNLNSEKFQCWVLKTNHSDKQWSEFWIDKITRKVLQTRDHFYGKFRYKRLVISN